MKKNKYIHHYKYKGEDRYILQRKGVYYGLFYTFKEAIDYRDNVLKKHKWSKKYKKEIKSQSNKYILQRNNKYVITKSLKGKPVYFGTFQTLQEAEEYRDNVLIPSGWDIRYKTKTKRGRPPIGKLGERYIKKTPQGTYAIHKQVNREYKYFGTYRTLEDAVAEREWLEKHDWSYELLDLY